MLATTTFHWLLHTLTTVMKQLPSINHFLVSMFEKVKQIKV
jgi:hypothetical protein